MSFSSTSGGQMVDMNVTPLVDVMLVLLIIFMVTVPSLSFPIQVDLPQATPPRPMTIPPEPIHIRIDAGGSINWNGSPTNLTTLQQRLDVQGALGISPAGVLDANKQPAIQIEADTAADYGVVAQVLSRVKNANLAKIDFVQSH
jgi:biopolymer transport protein ExbD